MNAAILDAMCGINRRFGPGAVQLGSEQPALCQISTGFENLDAATNGIPRGRIVEIFGEVSSGKTTLALHLARQAGSVLYIDADHGLVSVGGLCVMWPDCLEDALRAVELAAPAFDAVVIDTVPALPTREEAGQNMGQFAAENGSSRCLSHALPRLVPLLHRYGCTLFLVNQLREIPNAKYGRPDRPTGGRAIPCYAALRLETRTIEHFKIYGEVVGQRMRVTVHKNKQGALRREAELGIRYGYSGAALAATKSRITSGGGSIGY